MRGILPIAELIVLALIPSPVFLGSTSFGARHMNWLTRYDKISKFIKAANVYRKHPSIVIYALGISIAGHLITCFARFLAMQALDDPPLASMIVVITPILLTTAYVILDSYGIGDN